MPKLAAVIFCALISISALPTYADNLCSDTSTTASSGSLFDSGGSGGSYSDDEDCSFLIQPTGASSVTLSFSAFSVENSFDFVRVYDGTTTSAPLLATLTGTSTPADITSSSGDMLVRFTSDGSVTASGFSATWTGNSGGGSSANIVVTLSGSVREINAGAISLTEAASGAPEATATNANTSNAFISTSVTTLTDNALLLDIVGSGDPGNWSPGSGQTERWERSNFTATGASSTRTQASAGSTSVSQTFNFTPFRAAQAVASFAAANVSTPPAVGDVSSSTGASVSSLTWSHTAPGSSDTKIVVGISMEDDGSCPADSTVSGVTYDGDSMTFITSSQVDSSGVCQRVELWYLDVTGSTPPGNCGTEDVADNFDSVSFSQNDGSQNWSTDWLEIGESDGASSGIARVNNSNCTSGNCLRIGEVNGPSSWTGRGAQREADLSSATSATLTFNYYTGFAQGSESVTLEVSSNGGSSWTTLQTYNVTATSFTATPQSFDLSSYLAANTRIRFLSSGTNATAGLYVDDLQISYSTCSTPSVGAEWRFDETSWNGTADEVLDSSGAGNHGVANNVSPVPGLVCNAADLSANSTTDYLSMNNAALNGASDFSISLWANTSASIDDSTLISGAAGDTGLLANELYMLFASSTSFIPGISEASFDDTPAISVSPAINDGQWHHVVWTRDASARQSCLYLDGSLSGCITNPDADDADPLTISSGGLIIGQDQDTVGGSFDSSQDWEGLIDEVVIFSQVLDLTTVQSIRTNNLAGNGWDGSSRTCAASLSIVLSTSGSATLGGLSFDDGDIIEYTPTTDSAVLVRAENTIFDGGADIKAYHQLANGNYVLSTDDDESIGGFSFENEDLVEFDPGTGTATQYLNGDAVFSDEENIDAVFVRDNGNILLSTTGDAQIGGLNFADEDIVEYNPSTGVATLFFDGSALFSGGTDVKGIHVLNNGNLVIAMNSSNITLGGLTFSNDDLAEYDPGADTATLFFDGANFSNSGEEIDAVGVVEPAVPSIDHFSFSHDTTGVTCLSEAITLTAHDSSHNAVDAGSATVNLSTSTGKGDWSAIQSGGGTLNNGTAADGVATYTFAASSTQVTLRFNYTNLGGASAETFSFNVTDGSVTETTGGATSALDDPDMVFSLTGFDWVAPTQIAGKNSTTAPVSTVTLRAVRASDSDPSVCDTLFANQSLALEFGSECRNPSTCDGAGQTTLNGSSISTNNDNAAAETSAYTTLTVAFDADGDSDLVYHYNDAGLMQLHARYNIPLDDGSNTPSGDFIVGGSGDFVVKPAGLCVQATEANADCAGGDHNCSVFKKAGENFNLQIKAVAWQSAGEANTDFCAGNATTPNFQLDNIALASGLVAPSPGTNASLGVGSFNMVAGDNGDHAVGSQTVSEVGVFTVTATPPSYQGETIAASTSANIGRFIPDRFDVSGVSVTEACGAGVFTYMAQAFTTDYTLTARNTGGATTANYRDSFIKLDTGSGSLAFGAIDTTGPVLLSGRLSAVGNSTFGWNDDGTGNINSTLSLARAGAIDGPYVAQVGVLPTDADGVTVLLADRNLDVDNDSTDDRVLLGQSVQRYGRLAVNNAYGPEILDLAVPIQAEYYDGTQFILNTDDSCTSLLAAQFDLQIVDDDTTDNGSDPAAGVITGLVIDGGTSNGTIGSTPFSAGLANFSFSAPGAGNTSKIEVQIDLDLVANPLPWLKFDWGEDGGDEQPPQIDAVFGSYRGNDRIIYWRELF